MTRPAEGPLGKFIREQRQLAQLSLREMARMAKVSNAYLSQLERGLHEPSLRVMHSLADALDVSVEDLISRTGPEPDEERPPGSSVEAAIRRDPRLDGGQKQALLSVYRSYVGEGE